MSIITISRGTFSGGRDLAGRLGETLGHPCLSREVIAEAAEQYGVSQAALGGALARAPSLRDRVSRDRDKYLAYIRAVLCQHARTGRLIYHGNAGHHLLAGIRHVIRVRVIADVRFRVDAAMRQLNLSSRQAETHIRKVDVDGIVRQQTIADAVIEVASAVDGVAETTSHVVTAHLLT